MFETGILLVDVAETNTHVNSHVLAKKKEGRKQTYSDGFICVVWGFTSTPTKAAQNECMNL